MLRFRAIAFDLILKYCEILCDFIYGFVEFCVISFLAFVIPYVILFLEFVFCMISRGLINVFYWVVWTHFRYRRVIGDILLDFVGFCVKSFLIFDGRCAYHFWYVKSTLFMSPNNLFS